MKIYWSQYSVPEFVGVENPQRCKIWLRALRRASWDWRLWAFLVPGMAATFAVTYFGGFWGALASCLTLCWVGGEILIHLSRPHIKRLVDELHECRDAAG
jgi:hypothetical protein